MVFMILGNMPAYSQRYMVVKLICPAVAVFAICSGDQVLSKQLVVVSTNTRLYLSLDLLYYDALDTSVVYDGLSSQVRHFV